jgi:hypothetical protein
MAPRPHLTGPEVLDVVTDGEVDVFPAGPFAPAIATPDQLPSFELAASTVATTVNPLGTKTVDPLGIKGVRFDRSAGVAVNFSWIGPRG